ncbi:hypothetical protein GWI33_008447 [Rhynchophorus ferrugineus]|uniref:Uncharacterized protein n=1 Tax=Rhynchophorus ferrugineus TaxID=354439 RepID=A0A834MB27_RHYFE|nr:hypothetical protein GWI33_008447 [Rhynchophorus ferrugineus]
MAASDGYQITRRLSAKDRNSNQEFLVITGADLCMFPRRLVNGHRKKKNYDPTAANGSIIAMYGFKTMTLNLGLRCDFPWNFVIADVSRPVIAVDFMVHYDLLVDLRNRKLVDTRMSVNGRQPQYENITSIKLKQQFVISRHPAEVPGND